MVVVVDVAVGVWHETQHYINHPVGQLLAAATLEYREGKGKYKKETRVSVEGKTCINDRRMDEAYNMQNWYASSVNECFCTHTARATQQETRNHFHASAITSSLFLSLHLSLDSTARLGVTPLTKLSKGKRSTMNNRKYATHSLKQVESQNCYYSLPNITHLHCDTVDTRFNTFPNHKITFSCCLLF